jgi:hypothetical protein
MRSILRSTIKIHFMNQNIRLSEGNFSNKSEGKKQLYTEAQQFALSILSDPILKDLYTKMAGNRCSAYSLAVSEYLLMKGTGQWIL